MTRATPLARHCRDGERKREREREKERDEGDVHRSTLPLVTRGARRDALIGSVYRGATGDSRMLVFAELRGERVRLGSIVGDTG